MIQKRLKQPYYGYHGFVTGKVGWGEEIEAAAKRELLEETGLEARFELKGVKHKIDHSVDGKLLEDKFFFLYKAGSYKGKLKKSFEGGENIWLTRKDIFDLEDLFDGVEETLDIVNGSEIKVQEDKYFTGNY